MTNFLEEHWYAAATSEELGASPIGRLICGRSLVLFRDAAGKPVILGDRCPHRSAPLHLGSVSDGRIQCPYHGLVFDRTGRCVEAPNGSGLSLKTPNYVALEKAGFVWVFVGRAENADPASIPNLWYMEDQAWNAFAGRMSEPVPWQLMADNLLDLSHVPVTHAATIGASVGADAEIPLFQRTDRGVRNTLRSRNAACPPHIAHWGGFKSNINTFVVADWQPPNVIVLKVEIDNHGLVPAGQETSIGVMVGFPLTPADEDSFHHFYSWGRNFHITDPDMDAFARSSMVAVQEEDLVIIREQYRLLQRHGFPLAASYTFDGGVNAAHAILDRQLRAQAERKGFAYETPWYLRYQDAQTHAMGA
ncbi:MAG: aromatic ring-hydroxylating dioxygenase subunit alpha [Phenylobacterium sp.]|uniref:aromatic ring-hydroxylating dioxygenase subunit alpha n=1 Tax=Phenylobacterium sp. TaxID=1871053 RepID=UPI0025ED0A2A|nr:aromatic ring-hydroxylating dioxygenase subunit alpha [Phenylobacterium sp.]MCA3129473.1 aromatic ring-hydroxylating dioxygenase subunit alpha [Rhodocyclaceae bacterium]MCA3642532.1 aromatic ring-hydroxylating dioxygenase subunit alpha [Methylobacterium sp.]MCA3739128.1 aromatic ring-hydroxylating dioxygenase subunit alpha [Phenylobacterium sp.]MCA3755731.1 aromatic ring-hydroxylating dioxygenase subunit alpha [Phenylobacterium sp.]MCA6328354.1 aromatic ring-hydroxylating dioxygenase subuni